MTARTRRPRAADTWKHSGGMAIAQDLPVELPMIRRRYGSIETAAAGKYKYRRYTLLVPGQMKPAKKKDGGVPRLAESKVGSGPAGACRACRCSSSCSSCCSLGFLRMLACL